MMLMGGPRSKKIATIIVDRMNGDGPKKPEATTDTDDEEVEMSGESVLVSAARSIISAAKDGDTDNMVEALRTFFTQCYEDHESSEEDGYEDMHNKTEA